MPKVKGTEVYLVYRVVDENILKDFGLFWTKSEALEAVHQLNQQLLKDDIIAWACENGWLIRRTIIREDSNTEQ